MKTSTEIRGAVIVLLSICLWGCTANTTKQPSPAQPIASTHPVSVGIPTDISR